MSKPAIIAAALLSCLIGALAFQDPLAISLTSEQRAAGLRSVDLEVNGEDCRFCRINVERSLRAIPGVRSAKANMGQHRARVVYDSRLVQPDALAAAVRDLGVAARPLGSSG